MSNDHDPIPTQPCKTCQKLLPPPLPDGSGRTALLVEDSQTTALIIEHALKKTGYAVHVTSSEHDALKIIAKHLKPAHSQTKPQPAFTIVISDFFLPDTNGLHLAAKIYQTLPSTPVVLISSTGFSSNRITKDIKDYHKNPTNVAAFVSKMEGSKPPCTCQNLHFLSRLANTIDQVIKNKENKEDLGRTQRIVLPKA